ncbi:HyaD/HybD family hydrogenase maturation endopeptidase [Desulfurivibrio dismutans]|uniref:HyaD/HybD family hydrogenase maturation endopeptidase n=1 Tax=Desulfurivibrio dismutans TaxID=1398908 RepID=UPI0023D9D8B2|nr:HyaD/HybD family hydrogenase maturation endopeptidase [Desulfurivibrio alkaliphilus]MDF1615561.1 HyaD/HybD family hydrogenase maturation endopeptidase [Desulfurivibrio alkaliphilus]
MTALHELPKTLVLGVGNVLFGDEGLGVHLASLLQANYRFSTDSNPAALPLAIVDGGTLGPHLIPLLADYRRVLLLDSITANGVAPGEVFCFDYRQVPAPLSGRGSAHEVEMHQTLAMMRLAGDIPQITVLAAVPEIISETTFQLSPEAQRAAVLMEQKALDILAQWGYQATRVAAAPIAEIAHHCCRGGACGP